MAALHTFLSIVAFYCPTTLLSPLRQNARVYTRTCCCTFLLWPTLFVSKWDRLVLLFSFGALFFWVGYWWPRSLLHFGSIDCLRSFYTARFCKDPTLRQEVLSALLLLGGGADMYVVMNWREAIQARRQHEHTCIRDGTWTDEHLRIMTGSIFYNQSDALLSLLSLLLIRLLQYL